MNKLPKARSENLLIQEFENEVLIYDAQIDKAYCLNETSARVFEACDGETSFDELKRRYKFTDDLIFLALDQLRKENLLPGGDSYRSPFAGMNRREAVRRAGLATMVVLPVISALVAPTAANAASACGNVCFAAGNDACAGCNANVTLTFYSSNNGSCTGTIEFSTSQDCSNASVTSPGGDIRRS